MEKKKVFISHATPEDNEFSLWLANNLKRLGYDVWLDLIDLKGGEKFWNEIDSKIRNETCIYLLVYSKNICYKDDAGQPDPGNLKDGIGKEYSLAEDIAKSTKNYDFVQFLKTDESPYNLFIGSNQKNHIPFNPNWGEGLKKLLKLLEEKGTPRSRNVLQGSEDFIINENAVKVIEREEVLLCNWIRVTTIPEYCNIVKYRNRAAAEVYIKSGKFEYFTFQNNYSISFTKISDKNEEIIYIHQVRTANLLFEINEAGEIEDFLLKKNLLKRHVLRLIGKYLFKNGFRSLNLGRGFYQHYLPVTPNVNESVKVLENTQLQISKFKQVLGGRMKNDFWHYGVSLQLLLVPFLILQVNSHLIFTSDGKNVIKKSTDELDINRIIKLRRKKGKMMYNHEWKRLFLAFLAKISGGNSTFIIDLDGEIIVESSPVSIKTNFGCEETGN